MFENIIKHFFPLFYFSSDTKLIKLVEILSKENRVLQKKLRLE
ncbi:MAG: hypothetical protein MRERC_5c054 [Mycoplasmataceae bacterium RC_NB112A]|nr:MAG: hypothetical protein MRERC_5c054 [Mycoplasmataceae bacterium RC_NB112A]